MKPHQLLLASLLLAGVACTRPPPDRPGLEDQLPTTPKTPALEPTATPPGAEHPAWPQDELPAPGTDDDPDMRGTSEPPVGTPDPIEATE